MKAMVLDSPRSPLVERDLAIPQPNDGQVLIRIEACGVCRTDLHVVDGELADPKLPLIPGHEIVGRVAELGPNVERLTLGERVGAPWLGWTCGECPFCRSGRENLCDHGRFTGYTIDGGYAEYTVVDARFCYPLDPDAAPEELAPLMCAGLIGYRSLRKAGDPARVGIYGFGAAAHIITQVAVTEGREIFAFTRHGDATAQAFARDCGATWAGSSEEPPPTPLDAAIIFAPAGELVPRALEAVAKGGRVVCGGIHMSPIPSFPYQWLWEERSICSVANLTRDDGNAFLPLAQKLKLRIHAVPFALRDANAALDQLRNGRLTAAAVLVP